MIRKIVDTLFFYVIVIRTISSRYLFHLAVIQNIFIIIYFLKN